MLVKIAFGIIIFWLIGLIVPLDIGAVIYTLLVIATIMIMVSGDRCRLNNPIDN